MQYSIVNYKTVLEITEDFRLDPDYFKPKYLKEDKQRTHLENIPIGSFCYVTDGQHGYHEVDQSSSIYHLTAKNAKGWFANTENADRLAKWVDDKNKRSSLKERDLILSTRGTVGLCALVLKEVLPANIDQDVARIAVNSKAEIEPEFLLTYLNCKFGQHWLIRNSSGMVQQGLPLDKVRNIPIPLLSSGFQKCCGRIISGAYKALRDFEALYLQAEQCVLSELGLLRWKPKPGLSFIKRFSDAQSADRIDAEYFQPMYEEVVKRIKQYKKGYKPLVEIVKVKDRNFQPKYDVLYRYIELANISANGNINGFIEAQGKELPTRARRKVNAGDVLVSTIEGSLSSIALITEDLDNALCSTGFFIINSEKINSETLLVLFKSLVGQLQLKKGCSGTILTAIGDDEFKRIILPDLRVGIQNDIKKKITEMYNAKALSKRLLDIAKCSVEMAIEKNEKDAQGWIDDELKKLDMKS
jgi:restriction endonuclease S subunit